jgi:hypothetical protein
MHYFSTYSSILTYTIPLNDCPNLRRRVGIQITFELDHHTPIIHASREKAIEKIYRLNPSGGLAKVATLPMRHLMIELTSDQLEDVRGGASRALTSGEADMVHAEFGNSVDTSKIRVAYDSWSKTTAFTPGTTIHFPESESQITDFSASGSFTDRFWFMHEVSHAVDNIWFSGTSVVGRIADPFSSGPYYLTLAEFMQSPNEMPTNLSSERRADWHAFHDSGIATSAASSQGATTSNPTPGSHYEDGINLDDPSSELPTVSDGNGNEYTPGSIIEDSATGQYFMIDEQSPGSVDPHKDPNDPPIIWMSPSLPETNGTLNLWEEYSGPLPSGNTIAPPPDVASVG